MKNTCWPVFLAAGLVLAGCGKGKNAPPPAPAAAPPPAPTVSSPPQNSPPQGSPNGYLGGMAAAQRLAVKTVDLTSLNENCQLFNAQEGRYPKDLEELVTMHYIGKLPTAPAGMKLDYDATQGKVTVVPK
ncbi:MAG: hypothetical protein ABSF38_09950 [Verrucomicrobiota bacterium]|jgi:hypothetical protein